jgi:hypothetical protein
VAVRPATTIIARGDCNADLGDDSGDISAVILEIFDEDGSDARDVEVGAFLGHTIGCDPNSDSTVDAGDISCTILTIFNGPGARV